MKVRVSYLVDVDDEYRKAINAYYGKPGLANREEVKQWFWMFGRSMNDDLPYEDESDE